MLLSREKEERCEEERPQRPETVMLERDRETERERETERDREIERTENREIIQRDTT